MVLDVFYTLGVLLIPVTEPCPLFCHSWYCVFTCLHHFCYPRKVFFIAHYRITYVALLIRPPTLHTLLLCMHHLIAPSLYHPYTYIWLLISQCIALY